MNFKSISKHPFQKSKKMFYRLPGMIEQHPGTAIPHNLFDFLPHLRFVTMYRTMFTGCFSGPERAKLQTFMSVFQQGTTFRTQLCIFLLFPAVQTDHNSNNLLLFPNFIHLTIKIKLYRHNNNDLNNIFYVIYFVSKNFHLLCISRSSNISECNIFNFYHI